MVVRLHDQLREIYVYIRDRFQSEIDQAFDRVSRQIGFVVTTTVPVTLEVGPERKGIIIVEGEPFEGTLFARELIEVLAPIADAQIPSLSEGSYRLYLLWYEALKLRLRTDWVEPAHFRLQRTPEVIRQGIVWESHEPAHWFDPGTAIEMEEAVLISVIDEVYPELRLSERIGYFRQEMRRVPAERAGSPPEDPPREMLVELKELLRRYGY
jgi:hypothetical protein